MPESWRITLDLHASTAFTGIGATLYGGRWNSPGTYMVYTSGTASLATLETLVHLQDPGHLDRFVIARLRFDDALVKTLDPGLIPDDWRSPNHPTLQALGDDWVRGGESAVLAVPSAVVPVESNFLLNPRHPDFARIHIEPFEPYPIDRRLARTE